MRRWFILLAFVAAAVLVLALLWPQRPAVAPQPTDTAPPAEFTQTERISAPLAPQLSARTSNTPPAIPTAVPAPPGGKLEEMITVLSNYNDTPIVYYGRLEDQFGAPVAGATVDFSVRVVNGYESTTRRGTVLSDSTGFFVISGYRGQDLSLNPRKTGYALASTNGWADYSQLVPEDERAHPDVNNPVLIRMWKLQGAQPLVSIDKEMKLPYTDAPFRVDLVAGKLVSADGDLEIKVNRPPGTLSGRNPLDWSVTVTPVAGGLIETTMAQSRITYEAPGTGYQTSAVFLFSTNPPSKWFGGFDQMLFTVTRNGQVYCKVLFSFNINLEPDDPMYLTLRGVANTNSSPNWEADPNTYKPQ